MNDELFIWDKKGKVQTFIDLNLDFEMVQYSTREAIIYGSLAVEELCYFLYLEYLEKVGQLTDSRKNAFRNAKFGVKIDTLEILGILETSMAEQMRAIKKTRNEAAHNLVFNDIIYKGEIMPLGLEEFKKDCLKIWGELRPKIKNNYFTGKVNL